MNMRHRIYRRHRRATKGHTDAGNPMCTRPGRSAWSLSGLEDVIHIHNWIRSAREKQFLVLRQVQRENTPFVSVYGPAALVGVEAVDLVVISIQSSK